LVKNRLKNKFFFYKKNLGLDFSVITVAGIQAKSYKVWSDFFILKNKMGHYFIKNKNILSVVIADHMSNRVYRSVIVVAFKVFFTRKII